MSELTTYKGSIGMTGGFTPKGGQTFPLMEAHDIVVSEDDTRLDEKLEELSDGIEGAVGDKIPTGTGLYVGSDYKVHCQYADAYSSTDGIINAVDKGKLDVLASYVKSERDEITGMDNYYLSQVPYAYTASRAYTADKLSAPRTLIEMKLLCRETGDDGTILPTGTQYCICFSYIAKTDMSAVPLTFVAFKSNFINAVNEEYIYPFVVSCTNNSGSFSLVKSGYVYHRGGEVHFVELSESGSKDLKLNDKSLSSFFVTTGGRAICLTAELNPSS